MKKIVVLSFLFLMVSPIISAQIVNMTVDYTNSMTLAASVATGTYNPVTDHLILANSGAVVGARIVNAADGADTGSNLSLAGVGLGTLPSFGMGCSADGFIFAGGNNPDGAIFRYASESVDPVTAALNAQFTRTVDVHGSGVNTVFAVTGAADNGPADIFGTADGVNFFLLEQVPGTTIGAKNGIAIDIVPGATQLFGITLLAGNLPRKAVDTGSGFVEDTATWIPSASAASTIGMAYDPLEDILFCLTYNFNPDRLVALNGTTGALMGYLDLVNLTFYNQVDVVPATNKIYWSGRDGTTAALAQYGRISYSVTSVDQWYLY